MPHTINGMNAGELKQLLRKTIDSINKIEESITQIDTNLGIVWIEGRRNKGCGG